MSKSTSPDIRVHVNARLSNMVPTAIELTIDRIHVSYSARLQATHDEVKTQLIDDIHSLIESTDMTSRFQLECLWPDATLRTISDGLLIIPKNVIHLRHDRKRRWQADLSVVTGLSSRLNDLFNTATCNDQLLQSLRISVQVAIDQELSLMIRVYYAMVEQNNLSEGCRAASSVMLAIYVLAILACALYAITNSNPAVVLVPYAIVCICTIYTLRLLHRRNKVNRDLQEALSELNKLNSQHIERNAQ